MLFELSAILCWNSFYVGNRLLLMGVNVAARVVKKFFICRFYCFIFFVYYIILQFFNPCLFVVSIENLSCNMLLLTVQHRCL